LTFQADLSWDLESVFFRNSSRWRDAKTVLDFGCGNAYYATKLASRYPDKTFYCLDQDAALMTLCRNRAEQRGIRFLGTSHKDVADDRTFDFIILRHTLSYLPDRPMFYDWFAQHTTPQGGIVVVDALDNEFWVHPSLPLLEGGNRKFKEDVHGTGGRRDLIDVLPGELAQHGFGHESTHRLVVHSDIDGRKHLMFMFMMCVAEYDHGSPVPDAVRSEIDSWSMNPSSYMQYGLFGAAFAKVVK